MIPREGLPCIIITRISRLPRWAWEDRMERRLQHAVLVHMSGHVKPPGDRALGLDAELGEDAGERELLMRGGAVVGEGGDAVRGPVMQGGGKSHRSVS